MKIGGTSLDIVIREAQLQDYKDINLLNKEDLGYDYSIEDTKKQLANLLNDPNHKIYVAVMKDYVTGYIHANNYDLLYERPLKNVLGIAVNANYRKNGIGKKLLTAVENWAKDTDAFGVRLTSGIARVDAHSFYRACGYIEIKEQKHFKKEIND